MHTLTRNDAAALTLNDRQHPLPQAAVTAGGIAAVRAWPVGGSHGCIVAGRVSDAGTTATGQRLYTFTHQAFLEYFAAAHLTAVCDTPEQPAAALAPRIARQEWDVVAELAIQIKSVGTDRGEERTYAALLASEDFPAMYGAVPQRGNVLAFLARCTRFLDPPPRTIRALARAALDHLFGGDTSDEDRYQPLSWLGSAAGLEPDQSR